MNDTPKMVHRSTNALKVDLDQIEALCEKYENPYYAKGKVEKTKWLLYDNVDYWVEQGLLQEVENG